MNTLVYRGRAIPHCTAELLAPAPPQVEPLALPIPGHPGLHLVSGRLEPLILRVRLYLDAGAALGAPARARLRREIAAALIDEEGGELIPPSGDGLAYSPCVMTSSTGWDGLFEDGLMDVSFTCLDPIAYGRETSSSDATFEVGGTAPTWPVIEVTALGSAPIEIMDGDGLFVSIARGFAPGASVRIDVRSESITADGSDASEQVALDSRFTPLGPGTHALSFTGCTTHNVRWRERWL